MKISKISIYQIDLPLNEPYFLSGGRLRFDGLDSSFVRIETDDGLVGWGEACPWGHTYLPASGTGTRAALEILAPALLGQDPRNLRPINRLMDITLPGHLYAKSPLDMACWDILGQSNGMALWQMMGGESPEEVHVNSSISTGSPEEMIALIEKARSAGYRTHSAKLGGINANPDIERIEAISSSLIAGEQVTYDINRAWLPAVALQVLNTVSDQASWVEQPCETMAECAYVAKNVRQPILLDECLHSVQDHLDAWKSEACAGLKIKPNRVGGLTRALQLRDLSMEFGWRMHIEDVGGSALADTAAIHLASATPEAYRMDSWLCHYHLAIDPVSGRGVRNRNGKVIPPEGPGLGVAPDLNILGEPMAVYT